MRLTFVFSIAALGLACAPIEPQPTDGDHIPEQVISGANLLADFSSEGSDLISPVMLAPDQATVVGLMFEADGEAIAFEARGIDESGRRGRWHAAEETWREDTLAVARIELGMTAVAVELKVGSSDARRLRVLTWSAVVPKPLEPLRELATSRSALSAGLQTAGVHSRADWGARATQCSTLDTVKTKMAVHHTVSPPTSNGDYAARLRQTQAYHMDTRGWCEYVGYHFFVTTDGQLWEAREARFLGAHVESNNTNNIGVVFVGCFTPGDATCEMAGYGPTDPPEVMIQEGGRLLGLLSREYGITVDSMRVLGHRDHPGASTGCPGDALYARLADLRAIANGTGPGPVAGSARGVVWDLSLTAGPADPGNRRIENARVTCSSGDSATVRAGDAFWSFDLVPGHYTFTAEAPGYASATRELDITMGVETWGSIGLVPTSMMAQPLPVEVLLYDAAIGQGAPLPGVQVSLRGGAAVTTSSTGLATFTATAGPASLHAEKVGFVGVTRQITIGGTLTHVELGLEPVMVQNNNDAGTMPNPEEAQGDGEPMPVQPEDSGCGCSATSTGAPAWALFGLALLLLRRRR